MKYQNPTCYIATYYCYDNYGTRLQNYALCKALEKQSFRPITLFPKYFREQVKTFIKDILSFIPVRNKTIQAYKLVRLKRTVFSEFNSRLNICHIKPKKMYQLDFSEAYGIAGSDQIWSPMHLKKHPYDAGLFFLRFVPKQKRFAYAPSFGSSLIPDWYKTMYSTFFSDFKKLSVRENSGHEILFSLTGRNVPVLPDPTFLLNRKEWLELTRVSDVSTIDAANSSYIFQYFLSNQDAEILRYMNRYADAANLEQIRIAGNKFNKGEYIVSPDQFVKLIANADIVVTDSFHAAVFSIIFKKRFVVLRRTDVNQISRLDTLLKTYHFESALTDKIDRIDDILKQESFDSTDELIEKERQRGLAFLSDLK